MKAIIVGKEVNSYVKNGETKFSRTLYVIKEEAQKPDGLEGNRTEAIFVPFDIPAGVNVGVKCNFEYEPVQMGNKSYARLVDITPICKMRIDISPDVKH